MSFSSEAGVKIVMQTAAVFFEVRAAGHAHLRGPPQNGAIERAPRGEPLLSRRRSRAAHQMKGPSGCRGAYWGRVSRPAARRAKAINLSCGTKGDGAGGTASHPQSCLRVTAGVRNPCRLRPCVVPPMRGSPSSAVLARGAHAACAARGAKFLHAQPVCLARVTRMPLRDVVSPRRATVRACGAYQTQGGVRVAWLPADGLLAFCLVPLWLSVVTPF